MSRLSDAWAALCGRPRLVKETVYVPGPAALAEVFMGKKWTEFSVYGPTKHYYATCAQAHSECHGEVLKVQAVKFADGTLYTLPDGQYLIPIHLQPKPKRAKGAKA